MKVFKDHEYGFRYRAPLDFMDLSIYYLQHINREPSIRFNPFGGGDDFRMNFDRLNTFGISSNYTTLTQVSADLRHTQDQPITGVVQREEYRDLWQGMFGVNQSIGLNHTLGMELHYDSWGVCLRAITVRHLLSAKTSRMANFSG